MEHDDSEVLTLDAEGPHLIFHGVDQPGGLAGSLALRNLKVLVERGNDLSPRRRHVGGQEVGILVKHLPDKLVKDEERVGEVRINLGQLLSEVNVLAELDKVLRAPLIEGHLDTLGVG